MAKTTPSTHSEWSASVCIPLTAEQAVRVPPFDPNKKAIVIEMNQQPPSHPDLGVPGTSFHITGGGHAPSKPTDVPVFGPWKRHPRGEVCRETESGVITSTSVDAIVRRYNLVSGPASWKFDVVQGGSDIAHGAGFRSMAEAMRAAEQVLEHLCELHGWKMDEPGPLKPFTLKRKGDRGGIAETLVTFGDLEHLSTYLSWAIGYAELEYKLSIIPDTFTVGVGHSAPDLRARGVAALKAHLHGHWTVLEMVL